MLPRRKIRSLYTTPCEFAKILKYLEDLFLPLLLTTNVFVEIPHYLQPVQMLFLIVHQFSNGCCTKVT